MRAFAAALLLAGVPGLALAQDAPGLPAAEPVIVSRPVSGFVVDVRGTLARFGQRPQTADALNVTAAELPGPGLGGALGLHLYPLRFKRVAVGIGGEVMLARRGRQPIDDAGEPEGPALSARALSIAPQLSLNFGGRDGWSYISAGVGRATFETWAETDTMPDRRVSALNYGGGARWFSSRHLAFTVDLRIYAIRAAEALASGGDAALASRPAQRLMVLSAGVSIR